MADRPLGSKDAVLGHEFVVVQFPPEHLLQFRPWLFKLRAEHEQVFRCVFRFAAGAIGRGFELWEQVSQRKFAMAGDKEEKER